MNGEAHVYRPGTSVPEVTVFRAAPPLEFLRDAVGGDIEAVPFFTSYRLQPCVAFCNEHGKLEEQPFNEMATRLWRLCPAPPPFIRDESDYLAGAVVVLFGDDEFMESI